MDGGAVTGPRLDRQIAADQQGPLTHAGDAQAALRLVEGEAAAIVGHVKGDAAVVATTEIHRYTAGLAVADRVGERLLRDPIDDQLRVAAEVGELSLGFEVCFDRTATDLLNLAGDCRRQAEVVERGGAQLAGE